jgi:hypothetical protein
VGDGVLRVSRDGRTWTSSRSVDDLHDVAWNGRSWVAVGAGGVIRTSDDGSTWVLADSGTDHDLRNIATDGHRWVAVGDRISVTSTDGRAWVPTPVRGGLNAVVHHDATWIAVGGNADPAVDNRSEGRVLVSSNGRNWRTATHGGPELVEVAADGSTLMAVGSAWYMAAPGDITTLSSVGTVIVSTTSGDRWERTSKEEFDAVTWDGTRWLAVNMDGVHASADGVTWNPVRTSRLGLDTVASSGCAPAP